MDRAAEQARIEIRLAPLKKLDQRCVIEAVAHREVLEHRIDDEVGAFDLLRLVLDPEGLDAASWRLNMLKNLIIRTRCRASVQRISPLKGMKITGQIECYLNRTYRVPPT